MNLSAFFEPKEPETQSFTTLSLTGTAPFFALLQIWFSPAGIKMVRDVTNEQRRRRTLFKPTRRADGGMPPTYETMH